MRLSLATAFAIWGLASSAVYAADVKTKKQFGDWIAVVATDSMTDKQVCGAIYAKDRKVSYVDVDAFRVDMKGRGGVTMFRYRFGKSTPSEYISVYEVDNDVMKIPVFSSDVLEQPNLRLSGQTVLKTSISMDISLKGLKAARQYLGRNCSMEELKSIADGAPDWAAWQVTPNTVQ